MKIGLALSGGGFRATVFHLGVLARLAEQDRLEDVSVLSTVSGGSLCAGLVFALNDFKWPSSSEYRDRVLPEARRLMTTQDLQVSLIWRQLRSIFGILETRADDLSALLNERWGITIMLNQLPETPRWLINATCYETGKNWRFERFRMGDYLFGYTYDTDKLPLSDAMAASAGFPGLIGPLVLDTGNCSWFEYVEGAPAAASPETHEQRRTQPKDPEYETVHLWDGGVYDNLGLEGMHNFRDGWQRWKDDFQFLAVSDASGRGKPEKYARGVKALTRIVTGVMMDQVRSLRSRAVIERLQNHEDLGGFFQIGNTCREVLGASGSQHKEAVGTLCPDCLSDETARSLAEMATVISRVPVGRFDDLFRHGFEVADYTLYAYNDDPFGYIGYNNSRWGVGGAVTG